MASPRPDKPKIVSLFPPILTQNLIISTIALAISAATALCPKLIPLTIPQPIA